MFLCGGIIDVILVVPRVERADFDQKVNFIVTAFVVG
jgi:hypothetical protein